MHKYNLKPHKHICSQLRVWWNNQQVGEEQKFMFLWNQFFKPLHASLFLLNFNEYNTFFISFFIVASFHITHDTYEMRGGKINLIDRKALIYCLQFTSTNHNESVLTDLNFRISKWKNIFNLNKFAG